MLSIVIPVYNEVESLEQLYQEIRDVANEQNYELEIIFVDDGSTDGSWQVIESLAARDPGVRGVGFRRNFGKAAALSAGFDLAGGTYVLTLDADLQDDPQEIPRFLEKMESGLDVVAGWKKVRHDPWHKVGPSRIFNRMVSMLTGVKLHDHNCGFKCYRTEIFREVRLYGELHRFIPVLAAARGWRVGEIDIHHRPRQYGKSKYGVWRIVKGFLDLLTVYFLTGFGQRPQHLLGSLGLACFFVGGTGLTLLTGWWMVSRIDNLGLTFQEQVTAAELVAAQANDLHLTERAVFFYSIVGVLLGAQFMSVGFLAELMTAYHTMERPGHSIARRTHPAAAAVAQASPSPGADASGSIAPDPPAESPS